MKTNSLIFLGRSRTRHSGGMALVVTLSVVVLVTMIVLAFFTHSTAHLQIESSRTNRSEANMIAYSACDYVVGLFFQEMSSSTYSTLYTSNNVTIYQPIAATNAVPRRLLATSISKTDANFVTLVRQSVSGAESNASSDASTTAAQNGRLISISRWNLPALVGGSGFSSTSQLPSWVYVSRLNGLTNSISTNVIGRFSYNVYETSGLLDANAAGYHSVAASEQVTLKGWPAGANLTVLGAGQSDVDKLVKFRNPEGIASAASYTNCVQTSAAAGYLSTMVTNSVTGQVFKNNYFTSRQDLLRYAQTQNNGLTSVLPYLTTFSREKNAPSWGPRYNASDWGGSSTYAYKTQANSSSTPIRFIPNVRVKTSFTRSDGTSAAVGDPLLGRRFPLSRISLLQTTPPNATDAAKIYQYFGLTWDSTNYRWTYNHGGASGNLVYIYRLDEIANLATAREPDFFELIKAALLNGSLGQNPGNVATSRPGTGSTLAGFQGACGQFFPARYSVTDRQIMQIGLNMIDQYLTGNYPTAIYFHSVAMADTFEDDLFNTLFGIKDLPYLSQLDTVVWANVSGKVNGWLQPQLWNPHLAQSGGITSGPTQFRIRAYGECYTIAQQWATLAAATPVVDGARPSYKTAVIDYNGTYTATDTKCIYFSAASGDFRDHPQPVPVSSLSSGNDPANSVQTTWGGQTVEIVGFHAGTVNNLLWVIQAGMQPNTAFSMWTMIEYNSLPMTIILDYKAADGAWRPYNYISRIERSYSCRRGGYITDMNESATTYQADSTGKFAFTFPDVRIGDPLGDISCVRADPRTDRFSTAIGRFSATGNFLTKSTLQPDASTVNYTFDTWPGGGTTTFSYTLASAQHYSLYGLALNTSGSAARYADADNVIRPGDAWKEQTGTGDGCVLYHGGTSSIRKPVVLSRPFRSLAELGYVFRDLPFKTLDLSSTLSPDSALLDLFCLEDAPVIVAGRFNPNRAPQLVLQSLIAGGGKKVDDTSVMISTADASTIASALYTSLTSTSSGPIVNRSDLVDRLSQLIDASSLATAEKSNKSSREAIIRSLASNVNTRTWNLMIDVIAQSGVAQAGATSGSGFIVQGEKRYWLHVAIDRYTGEIIDKFLEPVYE